MAPTTVCAVVAVQWIVAIQADSISNNPETVIHLTTPRRLRIRRIIQLFHLKCR